jgi:virginiamycin B lyase
VTVSSRHIYWTNEHGGAIGRANLNGTDVNQRFITGASSPTALAVSSHYIYWTNPFSQSIGRANLNGSDVCQRFITVSIGRILGVATSSAA